jgi:peptidoglycan hydrolase CwlO-like protein
MLNGTDTPPASARRRAGAARTSLRWAAGAGALAIAGIVALSAGRADAQDVGELQAKVDAAEAEAQDLAAQIEAGSAELVTVRAQAVSAATREAQLTAVLAEGEEREAELEAEVVRSQERLAAARARLDRALDALANRLIAIYKGEVPDETSLLLDSDGFDDLTTRAELLDRIQEADENLAERVRELRNAVSRQLEAVSEARDAQAAHNDEVAAARDQIAAVRAEAEARAAALEQARAEQAAALDGLRSQVGAWEQQIQEAQAVSAAQAQQTVADWVGDYAIPEAIVMCESGGNWNAVNPSSGAGGAYQILPSTWELYGGSGAPQNASPAEQSRIAAQIWADSGASAWECAG